MINYPEWLPKATELLKTGMSKRAIARELDVGRTCCREWLNRYEDGEVEVASVGERVKALQEKAAENIAKEAVEISINKDVYTIETVEEVASDITHLMIPDTQCKPNIDMTYLDVLGRYIVDKQPEVIVHIGDHADMPSLSSYDKGKRTAEGKRVQHDIESSIEGMNRLLKPLYDLQRQQREEFGEVLYKPKMVLTLGNHECLTPDTEVLTKDGFIPIAEIKEGMSVWTRNDDGTGEWQVPSAFIKKHYNGSLYKWNSRSLSLSCTENHRVLLASGGKPKYRLAKEVTKNFQFYPSSLSQEGVQCYSDDMVRLMAWLCTDSYFSGNQVYLYQRKSNAHKIRDVLEILTIPYKERCVKRDIRDVCGTSLIKECEESVTFTIQKKDLLGVPVHSNKTVPESCEDMCQEEFDVFLETVVDADGSMPTSAVNSRVVYGAKEFCDSLQAVAVRKGWAASLTEYREGHWRVNLCKTQVRRQENVEPDIVDYKGYVYCLEVPNTNFMIRHKNKCHFTGNCRIERHVDANPELYGFLSYDSLRYKDMGWDVYDFLEPVIINGVSYVHFMANPMSGKPYGGQAMNVLKNVGESFCMGHKQTLDIATRFLPSSGKQQWAIIAGAYYEHEEAYKGHQGNHHWRGIVVKHNVKDGTFNPMFVSLEYLKNRYGKEISHAFASV